MSTYVALLRGINVGGHHKVSMADLSKEITLAGFSHIKTLLNSGNVVFDGWNAPIEELETFLTEKLTAKFGFPIPVLVRIADEILQLQKLNPFKEIEFHKDLRLYVSFLKKEPLIDFLTPRISEDGTYRILMVEKKAVFSVLDVSESKTVKGMVELELLFGKEITTRNWNTVLKIGNLLQLRQQ